MCLRKMKKIAKNIKVSVPKMKAPEPSKVQVSNNSKNKITLFWVLGSVLFGIILLALGWFLVRQTSTYNPYAELSSYKFSRQEFMIKSSEISVRMTNKAVQALKKGNIKEAIEDCKTAIDIFPIDGKPYILLTKFYLMTGQERAMYDTLTLAGRSYPNFNNIIDVIDDANLDQIPLDESVGNVYLANFPENKKLAMTFMFDDGEANVYKALPIFEKYGYRATIPVVAGFVADTSNDPFWGSWAEWRDAAHRGFEIANHSMYHRDSMKLHGKDFDVSIDEAKDLIEKNIGFPVKAYVFPHDSYTDEAVNRALMTHESVRTKEFLQPFYNRTVDIVIGGPHVSVQTANRLVDIGIKRRLWLIAKCHGVAEKRNMRSFKSITPEFLEQNLEYIHSKSNDVWVDTFSHVFEYLSLRSHTTVEIKNFTADAVDFVLHNDQPQVKLSSPLTVILKTQTGLNVPSVQGADGHKIKAWSCDTDKLCVDVDSYEENIHLQWGLKNS